MRSSTIVSSFFFLLILVMAAPLAHAQDTLTVSLEEFIETGLNNSGQVAFEREKVNLANNRINQARSVRFLPKFELLTQHGLVPGVRTNRQDLDRNELYLDPNLENDWEDLGLFTRAEVTAVQPLYSWGALKNAVNATQAAATAAKEQFESQKAGIELRLFELYQSYVLSLEIQRLLEEAQEKINRIERTIEDKRNSEDSDIDESEIFKFEIFKSEFAIRAAEVRENLKYITNIWQYVMQGKDGTVYEPADRFLDPVVVEIQPLDFYRSRAISFRSEIKAVEAGMKAAKHGLEATRAKNYPTIFLGLTGSFATTPNRPRQSNPFIINNSNYATGAFGIGIRQNLDFLGMKADVERSEIQYEQSKDLKSAAMDGIVLEINEKYKDASLAKVKIEKTDEALVTGKKWLRQEQLDYDFGIGDTKDLIDAMQKELELRVQLKREIFSYNKNMAELFRASGLDIFSLTTTSN